MGAHLSDFLVLLFEQAAMIMIVAVTTGNVY